MADTLPTNIDLAAATATTPKLRRTVEDQAIEKYIRDAGNFLEEARLNPDISEGLLGAGYDNDELTWGTELQEKAWNAYCSTHADCPPTAWPARPNLTRRWTRRATTGRRFA